MRQHKFQLPILSDSEQHTSGIALDRHSMASSPPEAPENRDIVDIVDGLPTPLSHHTPAHSNLPVSEQRKQNKIKQNKTNMYTYIYIYISWQLMDSKFHPSVSLFPSLVCWSRFQLVFLQNITFCLKTHLVPLANMWPLLITFG
jgi:hypothetical protein